MPRWAPVVEVGVEGITTVQAELRWWRYRLSYSGEEDETATGGSRMIEPVSRDHAAGHEGAGNGFPSLLRGKTERRDVFIRGRV